MIFLCVVVFDQLIKYFVDKFQPSFVVLNGFINIKYAKNTGGMYSLFENNNFVFIIVSVLILVSLYFIVFKMKKDNICKVENVLWQFVFAGGVSNLIDRIFRGYVVDFIAMKPFGIFNISDALIVVSVCVLLLLYIVKSKKFS